MKLKNKKTGEIIEATIFYGGDDRIKVVTYTPNDGQHDFYYHSLKELNAVWEDYDADRRYWYIDIDGEIMSKEMAWFNQAQDNIGNRFETEEEAELAVEKLKAWKRLKDKGFKFSKDWVYRYDQPKVENHTYFEFVAICEDGTRFDDLDLLFGGEE